MESELLGLRKNDKLKLPNVHETHTIERSRYRGHYRRDNRRSGNVLLWLLKDHSDRSVLPVLRKRRDVGNDATEVLL